MERLRNSKHFLAFIIITTAFIVLCAILDNPLSTWRHSGIQSIHTVTESQQYVETSQHSSEHRTQLTTELTTSKTKTQYKRTSKLTTTPIPRIITTKPRIMRPKSFIPNPDRTLVKSSNQRILSRHYLSSYKIGNQLFVFASLYGIARRNGITPTIRGEPSSLKISKFCKFLTKPDPLPLADTVKIYGEKSFGTYDPGTETLYQDTTDSIYLDRYLQSYKYFRHVETELRDQLTLLPQARKRAEHYIRDIIPGKFKDYTSVGIHIRLGDVTKKVLVDAGHNTAPVEYFMNAMAYYKKKFPRVFFIVCSNNISWVETRIKGENVFYSKTTDDELDFTTLAVMDHVIQSVGTFGWWAAWIGKGTSVYYKYPYRPNSTFGLQFNSEDFFLPDWIPMT